MTKRRVPPRKITGLRAEYGALAGLFFAGLVLGTLGARGSQGTTFLGLFAERLVHLRTGAGFLTASGSVLLSGMLFLAAALLLGASAFGAPILMLLPLARGIGVGCVSAWLVQRAGMHGAVVELAFFLIPDCAAALVILVYCSFCVQTSTRLFLFHVAGKSASGIRVDDLFRLFLLSVLALLLVSLLTGVLSAALRPVLLAGDAWAAAL